MCQEIHKDNSSFPFEMFVLNKILFNYSSFGMILLKHASIYENSLWITDHTLKIVNIRILTKQIVYLLYDT